MKIIGGQFFHLKKKEKKKKEKGNRFFRTMLKGEINKTKVHYSCVFTNTYF